MKCVWMNVPHSQTKEYMKSIRILLSIYSLKKMWKTEDIVDSMAQPICNQSGAIEQNCWLSLIYSTIQSNLSKGGQTINR